ncbi:MAG TPA: hypothetical protein VMW42_00045 [Desulfatiglandales bacterium]|nr:hypothetical protein [Desulfatiglandales bacterium]
MVNIYGKDLSLVKPAMPISSRRYLFACEHVVKYLGFADNGLDSYGFSGINPKYLTTIESCRMYSGDIVFQKQA